MPRINQKQISMLSTEINEAERQRAASVMQNPAFADWVRTFRSKFIVDGFLMPLYAVGDEFYISKLRASKFGDYIVDWEQQGQVFEEEPRVWIKAEQTVFWWYLTDGQKLIKKKTKLPERYKIQGKPAKPVWQKIVTISKQLNLFGEGGGGILKAPRDLDAVYLGQDDKQTGWDEGEDGYLEAYQLPPIPRWITKFHIYDREEVNLSLEVRPSWYHLLKYAFFNVRITRLPIFCTVINENCQIDAISFPVSNLSNGARKYIGTDMLELPEHFKKYTGALSNKAERRAMTWWFWHYIGRRKGGTALTLAQISVITGIPKATIQSSIRQFNKRLKNELDGLSLGRLLKVANGLGLGTNKVYRLLQEKGLVPAREREIDGFDNVDNLI